jgi:hypothetical protein
MSSLRRFGDEERKGIGVEILYSADLMKQIFILSIFPFIFFSCSPEKAPNKLIITKLIVGRWEGSIIGKSIYYDSIPSNIFTDSSPLLTRKEVETIKPVSITITDKLFKFMESPLLRNKRLEYHIAHEQINFRDNREVDSSEVASPMAGVTVATGGTWYFDYIDGKLTNLTPEIEVLLLSEDSLIAKYKEGEEYLLKLKRRQY